jgi:hypothetical protein
MVVLVLALLALGAILFYALPAIDFDDSFTDETLSFTDVREAPREWLWWVAHLGVAGAAIAALALKEADRTNQAWWITVGALLVIPMAISLQVELSDANSDVGESYVSLGSGIWLGCICMIAAAIVPWVARSKAQ